MKTRRTPPLPHTGTEIAPPGPDRPATPQASSAFHIRALEELLERDRRREEDGFPRKIQVGRMVRPGRGGKDRIVVVPTTIEEKFVHDMSFSEEDREEEPVGGSGEGDPGEVIGEEPVHAPDGPGSGAGEGQGAEHELESSAYDLGRILTEKFRLPNLKDKGKKRSLTRITYDMTDRNRGFGQFLDKKATLRRILETNRGLGRLSGPEGLNPADLLVSPQDKVYRVLSREKDYESQALVFFLRDYSGSMSGQPTERVVAQHVLIYSWLLFQFEKQVETRFVLHDTEAVEVPDFHTYYNSRVAGGTRVASAWRFVNEVVNREGLARDYNVYVFHGTDGDDWDNQGQEAVPELEKMLGYASRVGITVVRNSLTSAGETQLEQYVKRSGLPEKKPDLFRLDVLETQAEEARLLEGIRYLLS